MQISELQLSIKGKHLKATTRNMNWCISNIKINYENYSMVTQLTEWQNSERWKVMLINASAKTIQRMMIEYSGGNCCNSRIDSNGNDIWVYMGEHNNDDNHDNVIYYNDNGNTMITDRGNNSNADTNDNHNDNIPGNNNYSDIANKNY